MDKREFFFSTDHCQDHKLGPEWVSVTHYLPISVVPRESCPSGFIKDKTDLINVFYIDYKEIPNPNFNYQPKN